ncbi:MAG TPA: hypothetical protein VMV87_11320 [Burkholderiales bacterium]|nr:hypothetical protein [Burkholderiales bacterium]
MRILICIDDTDDLDTPGTGRLAERLRVILEQRGLAHCRYITRHQLYVHPDIPYTSHNSAMCFEAEAIATVDELAVACALFLREVAAPASDPGLCIVDLEQLRAAGPLVEFGYSAKREVLNKDAAYSLARFLGVHLSEHGGTGEGVIGALAGAGLRLGGNDGRVRGGLDLGGANEVAVDTLLRHPDIDAVRGTRGEALPGDALVRLSDKVKTVRRGGQAVLLVTREGEEGWRCCSKEELKAY